MSGGTASSLPVVSAVRPHIADDVARDIVAALAAGDHILDDGEPRPLRPSDFAVLVRNRGQGTLIRDALNRAAVPCVLTGGSSVFSTPAATAWQRVLAALEQPHRPDRTRLAALSPILGYSAAELADGGDALVATLSARLRSWAAVFERSGVAAMFEVMVAGRGTQARLLGVEDGERTLTDLRHLAQLMNREVTTAQLGLASLSAWLTHRMADEKNSGTSAAARWAANSREYSRTGSHVPSTRDSNRSASVSGRPTARRSRRCTERIALSIASSRGGTGRPRALRSVLVGTMVSRPFTSTRARRMCSAPVSEQARGAVVVSVVVVHDSGDETDADPETAQQHRGGDHRPPWVARSGREQRQR